MLWDPEVDGPIRWVDEVCTIDNDAVDVVLTSLASPLMVIGTFIVVMGTFVVKTVTWPGVVVALVDCFAIGTPLSGHQVNVHGSFEQQPLNPLDSQV